jgi:hypothetical protein
MKKLPIGISDFKKLREENFIYVDKTQYIYKLITEGGGYYFLSRPRRFGKSLLISTIRYLFEGRKELFKRLYIYSYNIGNKSLVIEDKWNWNNFYPVIRIDLSQIAIRKEKDFETQMELLLKEIEKDCKYKYEKKYKASGNLFLLIKKCYDYYKKQLVILVDEYDKVILDNIENKTEVEKIRESLKNFYGVLKGLDEYIFTYNIGNRSLVIRFVLITGVSKFSKVSLFSGLNQLKDISLDPRYGNICGYTQNELESYFNDYLKDLNLDEIKEWYNGYYFLQDTLYNPFDILFYLDTNKFKNYWYETGKTEFLFKLLKTKNYELPYLNKLYYTSDILDKFDIEYISIEALMFQTGYLTIKEVKQIQSEEMYLLDYPNKEVRQSFNRDLVFCITKSYHTDRIYNLKIAIINEEIEKIKEQIEIFINSISYNILKNEYVYQATIYGLTYSTGFNIILEDNTSKGRIDLTILVNKNLVYIIEFKIIQDEKEKGNSINQILQKEYYKKYSNYDKIYIIGIEFDKTNKQIANFEYQQIK